MFLPSWTIRWESAAFIRQTSAQEQGAILLPKDSQQCLETFVVLTTGAVGTEPSVQRPGMLLNILQCTDQPPQQSLSRLKMSIVRRLRKLYINPSALGHLALSCASYSVQNTWLHRGHVTVST